jgi:ASCH domain-containing protein
VSCNSFNYYLSKTHLKVQDFAVDSNSGQKTGEMICNDVMKCLSLKQPYADLLVSGKKTIETRTWNTKFRGQFLVHASKTINEKACKRLKMDRTRLVTGAIIGKANLYGVKFYKSKSSFVKDKNKHFAGTNYSKPKNGFLVNQAKNLMPLYH